MALKLKLRTSVGSRLLALIAAHALTSVFGIGLSLYALQRISSDERYMYRFQLGAIADIGKAMDTVAGVEENVRAWDPASSGRPPLALSRSMEDLQAFERRYETQWQTVRGANEDAIRFRKDLERAGKPRLLDSETRAVEAFQGSLRHVEDAVARAAGGEGRPRGLGTAVRALHHNLDSLLDTNIAMARVAHEQVMGNAQRTMLHLTGLGVLALAASFLLGMAVHRAIAPRIQRLVLKVDRFREFGLNERVLETGKDEIALLAHALDVGFAAIANRDRDRENFLAVAAHELKTPITSIHGFTSLVLERPDEPRLRDQALEVIRRQSWRLSRLIEDIFLAARARTGKLRFRPQPIDLAALVKRVAREIEPFVPNRAFRLDGNEPMQVIADESLLAHGLWGLFTYASALSLPGAPIEIDLARSEAMVSLSVQVECPTLPPREAEDLFAPFRTVEYEDSSGTRTAVGLYLSNEIAKLHNGHLHVKNRPGVGPILVLEFPG